jgi:prepilin-type N-terminal cleavage/methylation domain-containing protein
MSRRSMQSRRGFSLIEVVIAVIVLAIAVPPTLGLMDSSAAKRADAVSTTRATILASSVLEIVFADIASTNETLGMQALTDSNVYLNTPNTGLYARLGSSLETFSKYGFTYTVSIGELVSADGTVSGQSEDNVFRLVTVNVSYASATGSDFLLPVSLMVTEL